MYRIIFDTNKCAWIIQLLSFGIFWKTLKGKEFPNHLSAEDYVDGIGLAKVYTYRSKSLAHHLLNGGV